VIRRFFAIGLAILCCAPFLVSCNVIRGEESPYEDLSYSIAPWEEDGVFSGKWLDTSSGAYGSRHDSLGQWKTGFDPSGMIYLYANILDCASGIKTVEYAVFPSETEYDDPDVQWYAPHSLKLNSSGIEELYANSYLDYGTLTEGKEYKFAVRGVSNGGNYVLHLYLPFKYRAFGSEAYKLLQRNTEFLNGKTVVCEDPSTETLENGIRELLGSRVADFYVGDVAFEGENSKTYEIYLSYPDKITDGARESYLLGTEARSDFLNYRGSFFKANVTAYIKTEAEDSIPYPLSPADGTKDIYVLYDEVLTYLHSDLSLEEIYALNSREEELCKPSPTIFSWTPVENAQQYRLLISESKDFSEYEEFTSRSSEIDVYNLKIGTRYYWKVVCGEAESPVSVFSTAKDQRRTIYTDGVLNVRDMGGLRTEDGRIIPQGLIYRSANLDSVSIRDIETFAERLGVKTEIDLRGIDSVSPLGDSVKIYPISFVYYAGIFDTGSSIPIKKVMKIFADKENYPILCHCAIGRDRTETAVFLVLGLCGVCEEDLEKDYYMTWMSENGGENIYGMSLQYKELLRLKNYLNDPNASLAENIEAFLLDCGVTQDEINAIRKNILTYATNG